MVRSISVKTRAVAVSALLVSGVLGATAAAQSEMGRITIGTGPAGTFYNQVGVALSNTLQKELGVASTARPFGGTTVYLPQLHRGEVELGINSALDSSSAYLGNEPYPEAMSKVRAATMLFRAPYALHASKASGMKTVDDLKGKRVIIGYRSVASFVYVDTAILATAGLTPSDVRRSDAAGVPAGLRQLSEERVDATGTILNIGLVREADASLPDGIIVLGLGKNEAEISKLAGFTATTVEPSSRTVGVEGPTRIAQFDVYLNTSTNETADDVYRMVKAIHGNWKSMQKDLPGLRGTDASGLVPLNMSHPYHEGAVRYFKEAGLWTPEHESAQQALLK